MKQQRKTDKLQYLLSDLKSCTNTRNLERGRQIHAKVLESGSDNVHVRTALVRMYAQCGSMVDARQVFDSIEQPNVVSWTTLLSGYADNGEGTLALDVFSKMKSNGCTPDSITYVAALKACTSLAQKENGGIKCLLLGKQIHSEIKCCSNFYVQTALVDLYAKCRRMVEARQVFDSIRHPDVVSWTTLILGYAENGEELAALDLFSVMKSRACAPNSVTYVAVLKACASLARKDVGSMSRVECLERGKQLHCEIGSHLNLYVQNSLIDMYAKCGSMVDARKVFDGVRQPDVISWNALLLGYAENGQAMNTLESFWSMKSRGCAADSLTYVAALRACTLLAAKEERTGRAECLHWGKRIHVEIGDHSDIYVQNALVDMYAKGGSMFSARQVFDSTSHPDVMSWTTLILGYVDNAQARVALDLFSRMKSDGCAPDCIAYGAALKACGMLGALEHGRRLHDEITEFKGTLVTCLVDFYAKCGSLTEAQDVFDLHSEARGVATWNSLLAGYSSFGEVSLVFKLFERMQDAGFQPDGVTFLTMLMCCSHAGLVEKARECFETMCTKHRLVPHIKHYNCMVDVLSRANKLDDAMVMLTRMPGMRCMPNVITWMTILAACRKLRNIEIGRLAFQSLVSLDEGDGAPYALMAHIYGSRGMWQEQEMVFGMRKRSQASGGANETGEAHKVLLSNHKHLMVEDINEGTQYQ